MPNSGRISLITLGENLEYLNDDSIGSLCEPRSKIGWRAAELIRFRKAEDASPESRNFWLGN